MCAPSTPLCMLPAMRASTTLFRASATLMAALGVAPCGVAQTVAGSPPANGPVSLSDVVVSASRTEQRSFDAPASIQSVGRAVIEDAGPMVNLSESVDRIPGVSVLNRQNYSQDLQLSIRGFGARSTFGVRGVRLLVDGIPATTPDGQGQASTISLGSAERIEVLRGPLAQLYGNAAGGVVQVFTRPGPPVPYGQLLFEAGSFGMRRWDLLTGGQAANGRVDYTLEYSDLASDGYRDHSRVRRRQFNTRWGFQLTDSDTLTLVANVFDQPTAQDPQGLTRAQAESDPRQSIPSSYTQNTGKAVSQTQVGGVWVHRIDAEQSLNVRVYGGERSLYNWLGTPLVNQLPPTSAGAIVDLGRSYGGVGAFYRRGDALWRGRLDTVVGFDTDFSREARRGYLNVNGTQGALKRDEVDRATNADLYAQANWLIDPDWTVVAGLRSSHVKFDISDHFVTPDNPDDSGSKTFAAVNPVLGITRHFGSTLNLYFNFGRGFETPSLAEIAYQRNASGPNLGLSASRSRQFELGGKWRPTDRHALDLAVYSIHTDNELVVDQNVGGRTIYRNGGPSNRRGLELSYIGRLADTVTARLAMTWMRAVLDNGTEERIPGVSNQLFFGELVWRPRLQLPDPALQRWLGLPTFGLEMVHSGRIYVDDANSDSTSPYTVFNLRAALMQSLGGWTLREFVRVENLTDRSYFGSVIVNESNRRFFEPAPGRNYVAGISLNYAFR